MRRITSYPIAKESQRETKTDWANTRTKRETKPNNNRNGKQTREERSTERPKRKSNNMNPLEDIHGAHRNALWKLTTLRQIREFEWKHTHQWRKRLLWAQNIGSGFGSWFGGSCIGYGTLRLAEQRVKDTCGLGISRTGLCGKTGPCRAGNCGWCVGGWGIR